MNSERYGYPAACGVYDRPTPGVDARPDTKQQSATLFLGEA